MNAVEPPTLAAVTCRRPNECEIMKRLLQGVSSFVILIFHCIQLDYNRVRVYRVATRVKQRTRGAAKDALT